MRTKSSTNFFSLRSIDSCDCSIVLCAERIFMALNMPLFNAPTNYIQVLFSPLSLFLSLCAFFVTNHFYAISSSQQFLIGKSSNFVVVVNTVSIPILYACDVHMSRSPFFFSLKKVNLILRLCQQVNILSHRNRFEN